jgi:hypothetical protein
MGQRTMTVGWALLTSKDSILKEIILAAIHPSTVYSSLLLGVGWSRVGCKVVVGLCCC